MIGSPHAFRKSLDPNNPVGISFFIFPNVLLTIRCHILYWFFSYAHILLFIFIITRYILKSTINYYIFLPTQFTMFILYVLWLSFFFLFYSWVISLTHLFPVPMIFSSFSSAGKCWNSSQTFHIIDHRRLTILHCTVSDWVPDFYNRKDWHTLEQKQGHH